MTLSSSSRDAYIDFLRALGLLLLVVAHTNPPEQLFQFRSFDVPLMVFISAMCYKPIRGGYLAYAYKRLKRIYVPVFIFLTLFFLIEFGCSLIIGKPNIDLKTVAGSYLLLNYPSIGYVWIMRIFLVMALILPILQKWLKNAGFITVCIMIFGIIGIQHFLVDAVYVIDNKMLRFVLDETLLYAFGYAPLLILGLRIQSLRKKKDMIFILICLFAVIGFVWSHDMTFDPQQYKYPPQSLYLLYGLFGCATLWILRPVLSPIVARCVAVSQFFTYLSTNSMWIYLWHIIPVYVILNCSILPDIWLLRFFIVIAFAVGLNYLYKQFISFLPSGIRNYIK